MFVLFIDVVYSLLPKDNIFYKRVNLWKQGIHYRTKKYGVYKFFWARLASFGQLSLISDPRIFSKLHNGIRDPKGQENINYTMMKGRETFYGRHTFP